MTVEESKVLNNWEAMKKFNKIKAEASVMTKLKEPDKKDEINHPAWDEYGWLFYQRLRDMIINPPDGYSVMRSAMYFDIGPQPVSFVNQECRYASKMLVRFHPKSILDIGSYRDFILGLSVNCNVTQVDIRLNTEELKLNNEKTITCDAKELDIESNSFDAVTSLCSLEHFGLGRYGDEFDLDADKKAMSEMYRVLKPGGHLIFSTTITAGGPVIFFNAHKLYSYEMLHDFCKGMTLIDEQFFSIKLKRLCKKEEITKARGGLDVYLGCWKK